MRKAAWIPTILVVAWTSAAHENLQHFAHHTATFAVTEESIDVRVDIVFYGERAVAQRDRMDANRDGEISTREWSAYQAAVTQESAESASIMMGDSPLVTAPLYDPEVDLHGDWSRNDSPVTVQFVYFARRPSGTPSAEVWIQDTLWMEMPALCATRSDGDDLTAGEQSPVTRVPAGECRRHHLNVTTREGEP